MENVSTNIKAHNTLYNRKIIYIYPYKFQYSTTRRIYKIIFIMKRGFTALGRNVYTMHPTPRSKCAMLQKRRGNTHFEINIAANLWPFAKLDYSIIRVTCSSATENSSRSISRLFCGKNRLSETGWLQLKIRHRFCNWFEFVFFGNELSSHGCFLRSRLVASDFTYNWCSINMYRCCS